MHKNKILILGANSDIAKQLLLKLSKESSEFILLTRNTIELDLFINKNNLNKKLIEIHQIDLFDTKAFIQILDNIKNFPNIIICAIGELINSNLDINFEKSIINKMIESNYTYPAKNLELISQYLIKHNVQNSSIIGISSVAGLRGKKSNYEYGAAKSAFTTYLSGLRNKLYKNNIRKGNKHVKEYLFGLQQWIEEKAKEEQEKANSETINESIMLRWKKIAGIL